MRLKQLVSIFLCGVCLQAFAEEKLDSNPEGMVEIPSGSYIPLFSKGEEDRVNVQSFLIDSFLVTNQDYLEFVQENSRWKKSEAKKIFVGPNYLAHWESDLVLGEKAPKKAPVVQVSWFAAKAYCRWKGKKLPTVAQWELVGLADERSRYAARENLDYKQRILSWYSKPNPKLLPDVGLGNPNVYGVHDLHGLVWEWTLDFNTALVTGESRADSALDQALFCGSGSVGSSDFEDYAAFMRYAFRSSLKANYTVGNLGFRCVR